MDEIDWIKSTKKLLITITKACIALAIGALIVTLIGNLKNNEWEYIENDLLGVFILGVPIPVVLSICYIIVYIIDKITNSGRKVINFDKNYIGEMPDICGPATASLIHDLKIDIYKDYTATILYLCTKKYIDIEKDYDTYKLKLGERRDYSKLNKSEKYVLDIILNNLDFDANQFKQEIVNEAQEKQLITDQMHNQTIKWILIIVIGVILSIITYKINRFLFGTYLTIAPLSVTVYAAVQSEYSKNTEYIRTRKGKDVALLLSSLKNYIRQYTLIEEKEIDYLQVLEEYIPYAIVLDEADAIEEFIKHNEDYRNLIYNRNES